MVSKIKTVYNQIRYILNHKQKIELIKVLLFIIFTTFVELIGVTIIFPFIEIMMNFNTV